MINRKEKIEKILSSFQTIGRKLTQGNRISSTKFPITPAQWHILHVAKHHPDINIKDLADLLEISPSAVTQLVDGLVKNGILTRKLDSSDRRVIKINLSNKIKKHFDNLHASTIKKVSVVFEALNDQELGAFYQLIQKMLSYNTPLESKN